MLTEMMCAVGLFTVPSLTGYGPSRTRPVPVSVVNLGSEITARRSRPVAVRSQAKMAVYGRTGTTGRRGNNDENWDLMPEKMSEPGQSEQEFEFCHKFPARNITRTGSQPTIAKISRNQTRFPTGSG